MKDVFDNSFLLEREQKSDIFIVTFIIVFICIQFDGSPCKISCIKIKGPLIIQRIKVSVTVHLLTEPCMVLKLLPFACLAPPPHTIHFSQILHLTDELCTLCNCLNYTNPPLPLLPFPFPLPSPPLRSSRVKYNYCFQ